MPTLEKLLSRFDKKDRETLWFLIGKIISLNWRGLNIKKLLGHEDIYRLRKGQIRIIFSKHKINVSIISIERRNESTYKF
mgnify:FL=1